MWGKLNEIIVINTIKFKYQCRITNFIDLTCMIRKSSTSSPMESILVVVVVVVVGQTVGSISSKTLAYDCYKKCYKKYLYL